MQSVRASLLAAGTDVGQVVVLKNPDNIPGAGGSVMELGTTNATVHEQVVSAVQRGLVSGSVGGATFAASLPSSSGGGGGDSDDNESVVIVAVICALALVMLVAAVVVHSRRSRKETYDMEGPPAAVRNPVFK